MQYVVLLLAFLAECTLRPAYTNTMFTVEVIAITYFIITLRTKYSVPVYVPAVLLLLSNILTHDVIGLQSLSFMITAFVCHYIFIYGRRQTKIGSGKAAMTAHLAIIAFAVSFLVMTVLNLIGLEILGQNTALTSEVLNYVTNLLIFITIALCI